MNWLKRRSIRKQTNALMSLAAAGILGSMLIGAGVVLSLSSTAHELEAVTLEDFSLWHRANCHRLRAENASRSFQANVTRDGDFFRTGSSQDLDDHAKSLTALDAILEECWAIQLRNGHAEAERAEFEEIRGALRDYRGAFQAYVEALRERGFKDSGLIGGLRDSAHMIEAAVRKSGDTESKISLLTCRRHEKDYLLRGEQVYVTQLREEVAELQAGLPPAQALVAQAYLKSFGQLVALDRALGRSTQGGLRSELEAAVGRLEPPFQAMLRKCQRERGEAREALALAKTSALVLLALLGLPILGGVVLCTRSIGREITQRLASLRSRLERIVGGDLGVEFAASQEGSEDDLDLLEGDLREVTQVLRDFVANTKAVAASIDSSTTEIQSTLAELAAGQAQQASAVTETASSLDELRASAVLGKDRAREVVEQADRMTSVSSDGAVAVEHVVEGMGTIREKVEQIATRILELSQSSMQIGVIVESINSIADQSKLLALNASIEAAKAGEYGRGFAVVASEVRTLADRSQAASGEIRGILTEIQRATSSAVMATEAGSKAVDGGLELVNRTSGTIAALSETVEGASRSVQQIGYSVDQQTLGIEQISGAMCGIQSAVEQGAIGSGQIEQAMASLASRVTDLVETVSVFDERGRGEGQ